MDGSNERNMRTTCSVIGAPIDVLTWKQALERIAGWAAVRDSRYVCICNVHSVVTARIDARFSEIVEGADMATPDGAPVAWLMRKSGVPAQQRINGPDLMWRYCEDAAARQEGIFLFGGQQRTLDVLSERLLATFPGLRIAGAYSPPFRPLTPEEDSAVIDMINASGAGTVWVSLGCPKQETWMAEHRGKINATMIGVGAAFDYHAGTIQRAPLWMQRNGLEWLHRLCSEPRRLWRRYFTTNALYLYFAAGQLFSPLAKGGAERLVTKPIPARVGPVFATVERELLAQQQVALDLDAALSASEASTPASAKRGDAS